MDDEVNHWMNKLPIISSQSPKIKINFINITILCEQPAENSIFTHERNFGYGMLCDVNDRVFYDKGERITIENLPVAVFRNSKYA